MPNLYTEIEINAPREAVWDALVTKEQWMYWNTFLFDCDRERRLQIGHKILLSQRRLPGDEETEFEARIVLMQPTRCLRWISSIPGLRNECVFELQEIGMRRTKYIHCDRFSGILNRVFLPFIREDELKGIKRMARELKRYVEQY